MFCLEDWGHGPPVLFLSTPPPVWLRVEDDADDDDINENFAS